MIKPYSILRDRERINQTDLAKALNKDVLTIWRWRREGMPFHKLEGRRPYFVISEIIEWIKGNPRLAELSVEIEIKLR